MSRRQCLKEKLVNRERIFGYNIYMPSSYMLQEYMPKGVDYIVLDCEHGPHDVDHYSEFLRLCRMNDMPVIVRIPDAMYHFAARAMDCGADGVLVPRVESIEQVKAVVEGVRMPPKGRKGIGGKFLLSSDETIVEYNQNRFIWIQIESAKGVQILPEIMQLYGDEITACVIGPGDLSISTGEWPDSRDTDFEVDQNCTSEKVIRQTYALCAMYGKSAGIYCLDETDAEKKIALGTNLVWMSCDANFLARAISDVAEKIAKM